MTECRVFTVRLDPTEARRAEFVARVDGASVNDVFRQALAAYIEQKKADPEFMARVEATLAADAAIASQLQPPGEAGGAGE
jgi:predicted HicB family RNase H-like nuclease